MTAQAFYSTERFLVPLLCTARFLVSPSAGERRLAVFLAPDIEQETI